MGYETSLKQAREDRGESNWESSTRAGQKAIKRLGGEPSDDWIAARLIFGSSVASGELASFVEAAIERVTEALIVMVERGGDERVGPAHRILGYLFELRASGTRSANLGFALHYFREALKHYTRNDFPEDWGHLNIAIALDARDRLTAWAEEGCRVRDDRDYQFRRAEIETAIAALKSVLQVFTETEHPNQCREVGETIEAFLGLLDRLPQEE